MQTGAPVRGNLSARKIERARARAQVDEPALREGLPLKRARWESYLTWAVRAFRLSTVVAAPGTQIVTHLCYSEFADILHVRRLPLPGHCHAALVPPRDLWCCEGGQMATSVC